MLQDASACHAAGLTYLPCSSRGMRFVACRYTGLEIATFSSMHRSLHHNAVRPTTLQREPSWVWQVGGRLGYDANTKLGLHAGRRRQRMRLAHKKALVIGASRGMGKQMALRLAQEGADVAVAARTDAPGQSAEPGTIHQTAEEIRALGRRAFPLRVDLAIGPEVDEMCRKAIREL